MMAYDFGELIFNLVIFLELCLHGLAKSFDVTDGLLGRNLIAEKQFEEQFAAGGLGAGLIPKPVFDLGLALRCNSKDAAPAANLGLFFFRKCQTFLLPKAAGGHDLS